MEQLKQIKVFIHSIWTDLKESTTYQVEKILLVLVLWGMLISLSIYGHIYFDEKNNNIKNQQDNYLIQMNAESDYIVSNEAKLLASFTQNKTSNTSSYTSIFDSLQGAPLMIVSTDEHMINWINTVEQKDPSCRIEIEDIERKGNVVYVHCAVKSTVKP